MPSSLPRASSSFNCASESVKTISRKLSASLARASQTCRVENEILAQDRKLRALSRVAKILERAAEEFRLGKNGQGHGSGGLERLRERDGIERLAQDAAAWRSGLELRHNVDSGTCKCAREIAQRRRRLHAVLQRRFGQHFLAKLNLGSPRFQNAVEQGSGIGLSTHWGNFCMLEREDERVKSRGRARKVHGQDRRICRDLQRI